MEDILECCCGLDMHKERIVACILKGPLGEKLKPQSEIQEFGTQLKDLVALRKWLGKHNCHYVAMESTGIYWQPVYAVLETSLSDEMHLLVVNARHMKNIPGKKTDLRDAEWIATLLRAGLLKGSFIPEHDIRDLRQYTRYRKALIRDITSQKNRIEKLLQSQGFRLSSFLSDIYGSSGMAVMQQLVQVGSISEQSLATCLKGRARLKAAEILSSLNGILSLPQRHLLKMQLAHLKDLQDNLQEVEEEIHNDFSQFEGPRDLLDSIPGIDLTAAYAILAEIGHDMSAFPTAQHLCSWAGLAPGNYESAGKKKKQRVTPGNNYLKTILCEVAWVIASHKKLYLSTWYWRLKQRTDAKRAIIALARKLLVIIFTMLKSRSAYDEQKFVDRKNASEQKRVKRLVSELTKLGYAVSLAS
ncbi:MAG TPA: IS110 family transposase [Anaerolineae bacterium]|nr:IS110 family transposase [Anaerolineae bacterium]